MEAHIAASTAEISPRLPWAQRILRELLRLILHFLFNIRVESLENMPKGNCIVVANHLSWIDQFLLLAILPAEPRPYVVGASQAVNSPFKDRVARWWGGGILYPRGSSWVGKETWRKPLLVLESGATLILFPEGDVGKEEGHLQPLKRGIGHYALEANCPILPVALSGVRELYWRKEITVTVGRPFRVRTQGLERRAAIEATVAQVDAALRRLLPRYVEPVIAKKRLVFLTELCDHF